MRAFAGILYYFSSTANPILYNVMSRKFRAAFRRTVCCWWPCQSTRGPTQAAPPAVAFDGVLNRRVLPGHANPAVGDHSMQANETPRHIQVRNNNNNNINNNNSGDWLLALPMKAVFGYLMRPSGWL